MRVCVNGQQREVPEGLTVAGLVELLGLHPQRVAVERNRQIVRRNRFQDTVLTPGDALEIVTLVGGG